MSSIHPITILVVDDEEAILNSIKRQLRSPELLIFTCTSANQAIDWLQGDKADIVISDMRLPGKNGYELLTHIRKHYPDIIRIILSGHADKSLIIKTVAEGVAQAFLTKPWMREDLLHSIRHFWAIRSKLKDQSLKELVSGLHDVPTLPGTYLGFVELMSENKNIEEIATFLEQDPLVTMRILHIANSAFFGVHVGSLQQCLVYLGLNTIKNLILSFELFQPNDNHPNSLRHKVWEHASLTSRFFHKLYYIEFGKSVPDEFSCCGLLHDAGEMLMVFNFEKEYSSMRLAPNRVQAEMDFFGFPHETLGAYLLDWWNLPMSLVECNLYHQEPLNPLIRNKELIALIHVANIYAMVHAGYLEYKNTLQKDVFALLPNCAKNFEQLDENPKKFLEMPK
jgi:HD-like signal output (HDOD) protein/ActR/RegA family two-component response regulator